MKVGWLVCRTSGSQPAYCGSGCISPLPESAYCYSNNVWVVGVLWLRPLCHLASNHLWWWREPRICGHLDSVGCATIKLNVANLLIVWSLLLLNRNIDEKAQWSEKRSSILVISPIEMIALVTRCSMVDCVGGSRRHIRYDNPDGWPGGYWWFGGPTIRCQPCWTVSHSKLGV